MSVGVLYDGAYIREVQSPYTPAQVSRYLRRTGCVTPMDDIVPDYDTLCALIFQHTLTFPIENTDIH